jgi:hypothetical protein
LEFQGTIVPQQLDVIFRLLEEKRKRLSFRQSAFNSVQFIRNNERFHSVACIAAASHNGLIGGNFELGSGEWSFAAVDMGLYCCVPRLFYNCQSFQ